MGGEGGGLSCWGREVRSHSPVELAQIVRVRVRVGVGVRQMVGVRVGVEVRVRSSYQGWAHLACRWVDGDVCGLIEVGGSTASLT